MSNYELAPQGPPPRKGNKLTEIIALIEANPGQWVVIRNVASGTAAAYRAAGYEITTRQLPKAQWPSTSPRFDLYVRKAVPDE